jgi:hypothetical protein
MTWRGWADNFVLAAHKKFQLRIVKPNNNILSAFILKKKLSASIPDI